MPARWIHLLQRVEVAADDADRDLNYYDREAFYDRAVQTLLTRKPREKPRDLQHPLPGHGEHAYRDPTGGH